MFSTSALVLTALTVTGAYVRSHNRNSMDNGYTIDFTALEDRADEKLKEIAKSSDHGKSADLAKTETNPAKPEAGLNAPMEAGSDEVKIPGLTEGRKAPTSTVDQSGSKGMRDGVNGNPGKGSGQTTGKLQGADKSQTTEKASGTTQFVAKADPAEGEVTGNRGTLEQNVTYLPEDQPLTIQEVVSDNPVISDELRFQPETLVKPVDGAPIIEYSMDHSVYFATLDQYKYNPAVIYDAEEGEAVSACTTGRVLNVHNDAVLGHVLVLDLGEGYQAVYGQLDNIEVPIGGAVEPGMKLATVAAPTKYYSVEGANLYFQILKDGESIDPQQFF